MKQNNNKTQGNEKLSLATVIEFVYVIIALVFSAPSELISPIFGPGFNLICPKAD